MTNAHEMNKHGYTITSDDNTLRFVSLSRIYNIATPCCVTSHFAGATQASDAPAAHEHMGCQLRRNQYSTEAVALESNHLLAEDVEPRICRDARGR